MVDVIYDPMSTSAHLPGHFEPAPVHQHQPYTLPYYLGDSLEAPQRPTIPSQHFGAIPSQHFGAPPLGTSSHLHAPHVARRLSNASSEHSRPTPYSKPLHRRRPQSQHRQHVGAELPATGPATSAYSPYGMLVPSTTQMEPPRPSSPPTSFTSITSASSAAESPRADRPQHRPKQRAPRRTEPRPAVEPKLTAEDQAADLARRKREEAEFYAVSLELSFGFGDRCQPPCTFR